MKIDIYTLRQMRAWFAAGLAVAILSAWASVGSAIALESGVHVDPGSPAGKEYAVPLSVLRAAAAGRSRGGGEAQPLFGIGISPVPGRSRADRARARGKGLRRATRTHPTGAQVPIDSRVVEDLTRHGSSAPTVALFAILVVVGGLGGGALLLAARRRLG